MWPFKRKAPATGEGGLAWLGADMHAHLLPGIDDGSPDLATSVELVRGLAHLGYKKLIATPHILWEVYPNTPEIITGKLGELRAALREEGVEVELDAAAEYFIDEHFEEQLRQRVPLLTLKDNLLLVEFSMVNAPLDLQQVLFEVQMAGYQPVIAHPERYVYLGRRKEFFHTLRDAGCLFQLNLLSLTPHYGSAVQELSAWLAKSGMYDFAGTDLHGTRHLDALARVASSAPLQKLREGGGLRNPTLL